MITFWLQIRRVLKVFLSILKDDESRGILWLTLFTLFSGTMFYSQIEGFEPLDDLYFSFTTLTTIGYGDLYQATALGKLFTMLYTTIGLGIMGSFLPVVVKHLLHTKSSKNEDL